MEKSNNSKLLISSSARSSIAESMILANELNTGLEISRFPLNNDINATTKSVINNIKEATKGFKNRITLHAMFSDVNVAGGDYLLRETSQMRCYQSFEIGKGIGADTILFHSGNKGTRHYGSQEQFKNRYIKFWKEFIKKFEEANIIAVVENVFETNPKYCIELLEGIASPNFKLALDTGHVNLYAPKTKITDWIKAYGGNLYHMHMHNNYATNDDHASLEEGTINFEEIFEFFKKEKINPTIVLEMYREEDIRKSYEILKRKGF